MKRFVLIIFTLLPAFSVSSLAQDLTGIWRGYFITDNGGQYRFEVQIEQSGSHTLSGVTYSYQDKRFYGKSTMTGNFSKASGNALIQEIKTIEIKIEKGFVPCIQKCLLTYAKSGKEEFLEGLFSSIVEKSDSLFGYQKGDDCGGGTMYLRRVPTSDFYVEPFLRKKNQLVNSKQPSVKNNTVANNQTKTTSRPPATTPKPKVTEDNSNTVLVKPKKDSMLKVEVEPIRPDEKPNLVLRPNNKDNVLRTRENNLIRTLIVYSENVNVKLYDNGEIDDDTISVYLDDQLVLSKKRLTASAITLNLKLDEENPDHELILVAENLGRIPPNTSLMIVTAGDQRFEVRITSTEQKNAMVRFKYVKKTGPVPLP